jgi:hypothetical protein
MSQTLDKTMQQPQASGRVQSTDRYSVVVSEAGNRIRYSDDIKASRVQAGIYDVTFPGDIDSWAWLASLGAVDSTDQVAGSVTAELGDGTTATKVVRVRTFTGAAAADRSSHLVVQRLD